jgi:hypothetical protein
MVPARRRRVPEATYDGGTNRFLGLFTSWDEGPRSPARQCLGSLLLTPAANSDTPEDYADYLWNVGDIACELLGKAECTQQIRVIAGLGDAVLRESARNFLKAELGEDCP